MKTNKNFDHEEFQNRLDLAAAYHLADLYGFFILFGIILLVRLLQKKIHF